MLIFFSICLWFYVDSEFIYRATLPSTVFNETLIRLSINSYIHSTVDFVWCWLLFVINKLIYVEFTVILLLYEHAYFISLFKMND